MGELPEGEASDPLTTRWPGLTLESRIWMDGMVCNLRPGCPYPRHRQAVVWFTFRGVDREGGQVLALGMDIFFPLGPRSAFSAHA